MRRRIALSAVVWLAVGAAYFLIPLVATLLVFSIAGLTAAALGNLSAFYFYSYITG